VVRYRWVICGMLFAATGASARVPAEEGVATPIPWRRLLILRETWAFTLGRDVFPKQAVASVVGFGGTAGAVGGMLMSKYAGWVLDSIGSYTPIFVVAGTVYLLALAVIHVLSPRMEAVRLLTPDRPVPIAAAQSSRQ
jgi:nitrate/nitrite transporter NarK